MIKASYKVSMFAHPITINVWDEPIREEQVSSTEVEQVWGTCNPKKGEINVYCNPENRSVFGVTIIHELIEAANSYADLNLNHTQITTLAALLDQAIWKVSDYTWNMFAIEKLPVRSDETN